VMSMFCSAPSIRTWFMIPCPRAYFLYGDTAEAQRAGFPYPERDYLGAAQ